MRALVVDLNNFSRYPTLPVGLIVSILRQSDVDVDVLSPLARGVMGYPRLTRARPWGLAVDRLRYWSAVSPSRTVRRLRKHAAAALQPVNQSERAVVLDYTREMLARSPDVVLLSTYTMYERTCAEIASLCARRQIPVLVGGPYFSAQPVAERWLAMPGITAVFRGEPESVLPRLLIDLVAGRDLVDYPGAATPGRIGEPAPPHGGLDRLPFPDYSDFPWDAYPNRIIPVMTARGCEWGHCRFCADVKTAAGRSFRARALQNVLDEMRYQYQRHDASQFVFLDLKLNSDLAVWRGLLEHVPIDFPGIRWTASVHVDTRTDNGLSRDDLQAARNAGLTRITTGLESGSERMLKHMAKGTSLERTAAFVRNATEAGMSVRLTTVLGYPGEEASDVDATTRFLTQNQQWIERVMLNRYTLMLDTEDDRRSVAGSGAWSRIRRLGLDPFTAVIGHENPAVLSRQHRRATYRLMAAVHQINRKPLKRSAREFEGVM